MAVVLGSVTTVALSAATAEVGATIGRAVAAIVVTAAEVRATTVLAAATLVLAPAVVVAGIVCRHASRRTACRSHHVRR
jgi:hypothetical protein